MDADVISANELDALADTPGERDLAAALYEELYERLGGAGAVDHIVALGLTSDLLALARSIDRRPDREAAKALAGLVDTRRSEFVALRDGGRMRLALYRSTLTLLRMHADFNRLSTGEQIHYMPNEDDITMAKP